MLTSIVRLTIAGSSYTLKEVQGGYSICRGDSPTDRFYRCYFITADATGRPKSCSCPHCHVKGAWCKHLKAVEQWWKENTEAGKEYMAKLKEWAARCGWDDP